jgi:4-amino-4-deoxy-L-arabinose transferase-like glycosyltransferase
LATEGLTSLFSDYGNLPWMGLHHPPLSVLVYGSAIEICGVQLIVARYVALSFAIATILVTYLHGRLIGGREVGLCAAAILLSFRHFQQFAVTANNDIMVTFWFALSMYLAHRVLVTGGYWHGLTTGAAIGLGLLTKYMMLFVYPAVCCCGILFGRPTRAVIALAMMFLTSLVLFVPWLIAAHYLGVFDPQMRHVTGIAQYGMSIPLAGKLINPNRLAAVMSGIGFYHVPLLLFAAARLVVRRDRNDWLLLGSIASVVIPLLVTLPVNRYFLPCYPALAILIGRNLVSDCTLNPWPVSTAAVFFGSSTMCLLLVG